MRTLVVRWGWMMSDLPSREEIAEAAAVAEQLRIYQHKGKTGCITFGEGANGRVMLTILRMARLALSGRLVDREAIDYEAAVNILETRLGSSAYDDNEDDETVRLLFAAAIGDTEKGTVT